MKKNKILIIDDEELLTKTLTRLLERSGYDTFTAKNGQDAEVMVELEDFDLIISDIRMPGLNGVDIVKRLQDIGRHRRNSEIPIIFVTGFADQTLEAQAKAMNPKAYIMKPFDIENLLKNIKGAISS